MKRKLQVPFDHIDRMPDSKDPWNKVLNARSLDKIINRKAKIAIVGSGITAAVICYELSKLGIQVDVFESNCRIGGRINTLHFSDGQYGELGAMRVPSNHLAVINYIDELKIETRPFVNWNKNGKVFFGNEYFNLSSGEEEDFIRLNKIFPELRLKVFKKFKNGAAKAFEDLVVRKIFENIDSHNDIIDILLHPKDRNENIRKLMDTNLGDFVVSADCGLTDDEWFLLSRVSGMAAFNTCPVQQFLLGMLPVLDSNTILEISGGTDQFVEKLFLKSNTSKVMTHHKVTIIEQFENFVSVIGCSENNGDFCKSGYDHVVVTVPPRSLEMIDVKGSSHAIRVKDVIHKLKIRPLLKVLINFSQRFWGETQGLMPTDLSVAQVWYPSLRHGEGIQDSTVLIASYRWADVAEEWMEVSDKQIIEDTLNDLSVLHAITPQELKAMMKQFQIVKWPEAYTLLERDKFDELCDLQEKKDNSCKVHFCGEHTNLIHGWIISSVLPAQQTVEKIVSSLEQTDI